MSLTRRRFIETASLSALAGATLHNAFAVEIRKLGDETFSPENLIVFNGVSPQTFSGLVGESFAVSASGESRGSLTLLSVDTPPLTAPASLAAVKNLPMVGLIPRPAQPATTTFSLQFQGSNTVLDQGTYTLQNAGTGAFALFIVPSGPGMAKPSYTAVFNLLGASRSL